MQRNSLAQSENARARRVMVLSCLTASFGVLDLALTLHQMSGPGMIELNPLACFLVRLGVPWLVAFKLALIALNSGLLVVLRRRCQAERAAWASAAIMTTLMVHWGCYCALVPAEAFIDGPNHAGFIKVDL